MSAHPHTLVGLEELTDIRERTRRKRGKRATKKQRKANAVLSKWAFAESRWSPDPSPRFEPWGSPDHL